MLCAHYSHVTNALACSSNIKLKSLMHQTQIRSFLLKIVHQSVSATQACLLHGYSCKKPCSVLPPSHKVIKVLAERTAVIAKLNNSNIDVDKASLTVPLNIFPRYIILHFSKKLHFLTCLSVQYYRLQSFVQVIQLRLQNNLTYLNIYHGYGSNMLNSYAPPTYTTTAWLQADDDENCE